MRLSVCLGRILLISLVVFGCRPSSEGRRESPSSKERQQQQNPGNPVARTSSAPLPELHLIQEGTHSVSAVIDPSGALCSRLLEWPGRRTHLVCDKSSPDPNGAALRRGLVALKKKGGDAVAAKPFFLLASRERAADARALMSQEPGFFSHAAVWTQADPDTMSLFGPTFISHVGGRGVRRLLLIGANPDSVRPWTALAARQGFEVKAISPKEEEVQVANVLRRLRGEDEKGRSESDTR